MRALYFLPQQKISEMMQERSKGKSIRDLKSIITDECTSHSCTCVFSQVSQQLEDFKDRCAFLEELGLEFYQEKTVFILTRYEKERIQKYNLRFTPPDTIGNDRFADLIARTLEATLDRSDRLDVLTSDAHTVARGLIHDVHENFGNCKTWWQIGLYNGNIAGFVLPVTFDGCDKDGLIEGSIQLFGVLPEFRGKGFGKELLNKGCEILNDVGMWRIYNDVDSENIPSIKAFRSLGHKETDKIIKFQMKLF